MPLLLHTGKRSAFQRARLIAIQPFVSDKLRWSFWSHHRRATHLFSEKIKVRYLLSPSAPSAHHSQDRRRPFSIQDRAVNLSTARRIMLVHSETYSNSFIKRNGSKQHIRDVEKSSYLLLNDPHCEPSQTRLSVI